jgi:hypothetical protein
MDTKPCQEVTREISSIRSGILLTAWTIEALNEEAKPESRKREFELFEGTSFFLNLLAERLNDVYRKVHVE